MSSNGHYSQTRWSLADLLPSSEAVAPVLANLETTTTALENLRPTLSEDMSGEAFAEMLTTYEQWLALASRVGAYGSLWFAEDTQSQAALGFMGRIDQLLTEAQNRILFLSLWWKALPDEAAQRLLDYAGDMRYSLEQQRLFKDHTLTEAEEKLINIKDINGIDALVTLYDMITNKFTFSLAVDGETKHLTRDQLMTHVRQPNAELRAAAYQELYRVYEQEASVLAQIYIHRVRDWATENVRLRHFAAPISVRNRANDIPDAVVDTLLSVCAEQAPVFHRYFKLKADWLGLPKLRRYDLYAPFQQEAARKIPYGEGVTMVLDTFNEFSSLVGQQAQRVFETGHIDSEVRHGKQGGAFCASVLPDMVPWVLINYTDEPRDVATLAHELGHAIHAMLASEHSVATFHATLPLAETASVFSEQLLTDRLLTQETDAAVRRSLLADAIDDAYATVLRQAYFVLFEREAHRLIAEGKTMDDLNTLYFENLTQQFGDAVELSDNFKHEWICIPHIYHTPFYCYAYSFGQLLSLSLYQQYRAEGESFTPKLTKILAYGGSASPNHILTEAGINIADPDFWRGGFKVIEGLVDDLAATI